MQAPRRRKILLYLLLFFLVIAAAGYLFRYPLMLQFQLSRIRSLPCHTSGSADCLKKVWVHRVNSIERYSILEKNFDGFETDIVYQDSDFYVGHPPLMDATGPLSLDEFLSKTDISNKNFWFDTRGVHPDNLQDALSNLETLNKKHPLKSQCIFEVYFLPVAALLKENGYKVSFNVSEDWLKRLPANFALKDSLNVALANIDYVSQDASHLQELKNYFPKKRILTWQLPINSFFKTDSLRAILNDSQVDVVLLNIKSKYYR